MFDKAIKTLLDCNDPDLEDAIDALDNLANYCTDGVDIEDIYEIINDQIPYYYEVYEELKEAENGR